MKTILIIAMCCCLTLQGCPTAWIDTALADLPILINLLTAIASLADPALQKDITEYAQEATVDLQLVKTLITEYNQADAATKATNLAKINAVLSEVSSHLNAILVAAHVTNNAKAQHIVEAVNLALLTVTTVSQLVNGKKTTARLTTPEELTAELLTFSAPLYSLRSI